MYSFLLKRALPFTITFVFGAALSGLLGLFGHSEKKVETYRFTRTYEFGSRCRSVRPRNLVAETPGGDPSRVVAVGVRLDGLLRGPGVNQASGAALARTRRFM